MHNLVEYCLFQISTLDLDLCQWLSVYRKLESCMSTKWHSYKHRYSLKTYTIFDINFDRVEELLFKFASFIYQGIYLPSAKFNVTDLVFSIIGLHLVDPWHDQVSSAVKSNGAIRLLSKISSPLITVNVKSFTPPFAGLNGESAWEK